MENKKSRNSQKPIEHHDTAAWANTDSRKRKSGVNKPDGFQIFNAKEYVDENQK